MNKRTFLKSTAALAAAPVILARTKLAAASIVERQKQRQDRKTLGPTPVYAYDSDTEKTTFWRYGEPEQRAFAYLNVA